MSRTVVLALAGMLVACMPTMRQREWDIRLIGSADSVLGSYITADTEGAEGHGIRDALPFRVQSVSGTMNVSAVNGSLPRDTLRLRSGKTASSAGLPLDGLPASG
jgi:hypothetical protein